MLKEFYEDAVLVGTDPEFSYNHPKRIWPKNEAKFFKYPLPHWSANTEKVDVLVKYQNHPLHRYFVNQEVAIAEDVFKRFKEIHNSYIEDFYCDFTELTDYIPEQLPVYDSNIMADVFPAIILKQKIQDLIKEYLENFNKNNKVTITRNHQLWIKVE